MRNLGYIALAIAMAATLGACGKKKETRVAPGSNTNGTPTGRPTQPRTQPPATQPGANATIMEGFWMLSCTSVVGGGENYSYHDELVVTGNAYRFFRFRYVDSRCESFDSVSETSGTITIGADVAATDNNGNAVSGAKKVDWTDSQWENPNDPYYFNTVLVKDNIIRMSRDAFSDAERSTQLLYFHEYRKIQ